MLFANTHRQMNVFIFIIIIIEYHFWKKNGKIENNVQQILVLLSKLLSFFFLVGNYGFICKLSKLEQAANIVYIEHSLTEIQAF